jgi:diaminohydroxyphosphoribosylaminopyrimidine deaminase / 5-amino-6-(5-phosphoribosylamino)uracil reductase
VMVLPTEGVKVDLKALMQELGRREVNELHVEAGYKLNGSLLRMGCVDEMLMYFAPCLLGPTQGIARLPELQQLSDRIPMRFHRIEAVGDDLRVITRLNNL